MKTHHSQFVEDVEEAGLEWQHYNGRYFYSGPAVRCSNIQDVLAVTKVRCHWDQLGLGFIVYPLN